ncbi:hypothetical protein G647_06767 [Cladophialophora carrionii CBS 160.54]|uniref:Uncharacterized protein n=1 Tax=Cladophialophora carrionii CBS 160.54 TaxID=1279043 RepID=V9D7P7_9EURO|nr:uncharacterized protein G647_06767 [Cladophialophora carrionii CBS 160.54]ETI22691.1 hypothetical protein G647_06767 [Cladophialophora carrionii CBS 160.54]
MPQQPNRDRDRAWGNERQQNRRRDFLRGLFRGFHARRLARHEHEHEYKNKDETPVNMGRQESNGDSNMVSNDNNTSFDGSSSSPGGQIPCLHSHSHLTPTPTSGVEVESAKTCDHSGGSVQRRSRTDESQGEGNNDSHGNSSRDSVDDDDDVKRSSDITRKIETETETKSDPDNSAKNGPGPAIDAISSSFLSSSSQSTFPHSSLWAIGPSPQNGSIPSSVPAIDSASVHDDSDSDNSSSSSNGSLTNGTPKTKRARRTTVEKIEQSAKITLDNECARAELEEAGIHVVDFATGYATSCPLAHAATHSTCRDD